MSNIRWDDWEKVTPREWVKLVRYPNAARTTFIIIRIVEKDVWELILNSERLATFNSWDEAAGAAPMLFQLHKDSK